MNVLAAFSPEEITAIRLSLKVAFWAMTASLPVGIVVALLLARGRFWGMSLLNGVVHLPLIMPPVVTGYILLLLFGRRGPLGQPLDEYLGTNFWFDPLVHNLTMRRAVVDTIGADRLVYGDNFGGSDGIREDLTEGLDLSPEDRDKIRFGNALKLLKIKD